eukprot:3229141-Rhodomonas_salina.2
MLSGVADRAQHTADIGVTCAVGGPRVQCRRIRVLLGCERHHAPAVPRELRLELERAPVPHLDQPISPAGANQAPVPAIGERAACTSHAQSTACVGKQRFRVLARCDGEDVAEVRGCLGLEAREQRGLAPAAANRRFQTAMSWNKTNSKHCMSSAELSSRQTAAECL